MPKMTVTLQSLPAESYLLLLVVACAATDVVYSARRLMWSSSGLQFSCPGDEDLLYVGCRFIDEELLDSVKQGQSDQLSLVTQNVDRMSSVCSQGCRLQMDACIPQSPAYGLAVRYCGCRAALSTDCDASLSIALPVFMNPQFSVSNYHLGLDTGIPVTEELNNARSEVCGSSCRTPLETSEQCSYAPLRDAINAMCSCDRISQQCSDLYTTMVDLSDPTDPEKFPDVAAFLTAVDSTKTLTERILAVLSPASGIDTVHDLFLAPLRELCVRLDLNGTELSNAITSCKRQCPALANLEVEAAATSLAELCPSTSSSTNTVSHNFCGDVVKAIETCMPSFSAARLISLAANSGFYFVYADGRHRRQRHLLQQQAYAEARLDEHMQWLMTEPAAMIMALILGDTTYRGVGELMSDDMKAVQRSLCSAECSSALYCPFNLTWYYPYGLDDFLRWIEPLIINDGFCDSGQPTTTTLPILSSSPQPPPPPVSSQPAPSRAPAPSTQIRYFLTIVGVRFAVSLLTAADAQYYLSRVTAGDWTPGETVVRLLGIESPEQYITQQTWGAHFAVAFPAVDESALMQLNSELEDRLVSEGTYFNVSSLNYTRPEEGTSLEAVSATFEALAAQYATTQPPPPSSAIATPPPLSAQMQARILRIVVGIPTSANDLEENYTVTLEARVVADLAALPGVSRESVHTLSAVDGVVELAVVVIDDGGANRDVNYQNLRTALSSFVYPSRQYGRVSPYITSTVGEGYSSVSAAHDMIVWMLDRANSTHSRTVRVDVQLPPTITEDDFAASLEAQFVVDIAALPGIDMQNVRILRIADGVVEAAVIVADAGGIYHVDDNYQALVAAMAAPSDHFSRQFGDDLAARVVSAERVNSLSTAEDDMAALLEQVEFPTFSISRVDLELLSLSSDDDFSPALETQLVSDLAALPGVDSQNIHLLRVTNGVVQVAVVITSAGGAYESDNANAFRGAMYSESDHFSSDLGTINARFNSNQRMSNLTAANAEIAALREQVDFATMRIVRIDVELLPMDRADELFSEATQAQVVTDFAALPGVNSENVNILRVADGVVEMAVVVIDEGGADQDGHYQNLLTTMASPSYHFSSDLGDVTARVIGTDRVYSLAAANQVVARLQEQVRKSGADFRVVRIHVALSLPNDAGFTDAIRAMLVSNLATLDGLDSGNVHVLGVADGVVDLAVIVTNESGNVEKLTTAIMSAESGLFSSELGVVAARIVSSEVAISLSAAEIEVEAMKDEVASAVCKCSASMTVFLAWSFFLTMSNM